MCLQLCKEEGATQVLAITERSDMGIYEVPLSISLLWESKRTYAFRCMMFSLSGPCDIISLYFMCCSVNGSVCVTCL